MSETLLTNLDMDALKAVADATETNVTNYTEISDSIVLRYTADLDQLMTDMRHDVIENDASDLVLEKYLLELNNMLYFLGSKLENVGIRDDLTKMAAKETFNDAYLGAREKDVERRNKTTVAELTAIAEDASKYETVINSLYSRVYNQIKLKMNAGYDMVNSLRKIISKRMQDASMSFYPTPAITLNTAKEEAEI